MSEQNPPNVPYFNGINFNSQFFSDSTGGLTYADALKKFLTYPSGQGNWTTNYNMTLNNTLNQNGVANFNNDVNLNGDVTFNGSLVLTKRPYQNLNSSWDAVNGYYELAKDAYPIPNVNTSGAKAVSTWINRTTIANQWVGLCWCSGLMLFVASSITPTGTSKIMTSSDAINWTTRVTPADSNVWRNVAYSPKLNLIVVVGDSGVLNDSVLISSDGITFTPIVVPNDSNWYGICWSNELNLFVATADFTNTGGISIMTSTNGTTWVNRSIPLPSTYGFRSIVWAAELGLFVTVSSLAPGTGNLTRILRSSDGITWFSSNIPVSRDLFGIAWSSERGLFVACAINNTSQDIITSYDAITWTMQTVPVLNQWRYVSWSSQLGLFLATGTSSIISSPDGVIWSIRLSSSPNVWRSIEYSPELSLYVTVSQTPSTLGVLTSSLKSRYPTSYNVFDSPFNAIDENGNWLFKANSIFSDTDITINPLLNVNFSNKNLSNILGITQTTPVLASTLFNTLRMCNILSNYATGTSSNITAAMYDAVNGRGLNFIVNSPLASFSPMTGVNDCVITTRNRPIGEAIGLTMALNTSLGCGIRLSSINDAVTELVLRCNLSQIIMSSNAANPISINDRIFMSDTTTSRRRIDNVSILNLFDVSNTSGRLELLVDSPTTQVQYRSLTNSFFHTFYVTNSSGFINARFTIADGNVSTIGCNLHVRSVVTQIRMEFNTATDATSEILCTNASSLNSILNIRVRNSANSIITAQTISPTQITENVPVDSTAVNPSLPNQNGSVSSFSGTTSNITSGTTITSYFPISFPHVGTYMLCLNRQINNGSGSAVTVNQFYSGLSDTTTTLYSITSGNVFSNSTFKQFNFSVPASTEVQFGSSNMIVRTNSTNQVIYFNGFLNHTGTNMTISIIATWTKIC